MVGRAVAQGVFVHGLIVVPMGALLEVVGVEFPVFARVVEAGLEAGGLFRFRNVQEELDDARAVVGSTRQLTAAAWGWPTAS